VPLYNSKRTRQNSRRQERRRLIVVLQADRTRDQRDVASIAAQARELFEEWAAEEEAGYKGEVSWEEFKRELNAGRPSHSEPFRESS
jgi:L-amino acid N-acyltransferase YncA